VSLEVHATHWPLDVSQTWCIGSQAAQSELTWQPIVGVPWSSVGQVRPAGTQLPQLEHSSPASHPVPVSALQATQRPSSARQVLRPPSQAPQCASSEQLWSKQIAGSSACGPFGPSSPSRSMGSLCAQPAAKSDAATRARADLRERVPSVMPFPKHVARQDRQGRGPP
jgi:hypothetical protein